MAIDFLKASEVKPGYTSWFFYGETRTGKTTAAATFPKPLFIQPTLEDSHVSLTHLDHVSVVFTDKMEKTDEIITELEARAAKAVPLWKANRYDEGDKIFPWETVVVESLTHYCDGVIEELTKNGRVDMDQQKWGKLTAHLRGIHTRLKALPVHVVYVALVKKVYDRTGHLVDSDFAFPGGMQMKLPSACNGVVYFEKKDGKPTLYTAHLTTTGVYSAGNRYQQLRGMRNLMPFKWSELAPKLGF